VPVPAPAPPELGGFFFAACSLAAALSSLGAAAEQATAVAARRRATEMRETDMRQDIVVTSLMIETTTLTPTSTSRSSTLRQQHLVISSEFAMDREVRVAKFSDTRDVSPGCTRGVTDTHRCSDVSTQARLECGFFARDRRRSQPRPGDLATGPRRDVQDEVSRHSRRVLRNGRRRVGFARTVSCGLDVALGEPANKSVDRNSA
jgi:hypothetical protein